MFWATGDVRPVLGRFWEMPQNSLETGWEMFLADACLGDGPFFFLGGARFWPRIPPWYTVEGHVFAAEGGYLDVARTFGTGHGLVPLAPL